VEKAFGRVGVTVLSAIALFATSNTVLMMLVAGSRIMFGMSRERALPSALGRVHAATKTPWIAVVLMMLLTSTMVVLSRGSISMVANIAVFSIFMVYVGVNLSLIWLRYKKPDLERPFRSPVRISWFPVLAGLGFATSLAMLTQFDGLTMIAGAAAIAAGLASYAVIGRYKRRQYPRDAV
jgi:APA family basic amino acid/polyamine antiporter